MELCLIYIIPSSWEEKIRWLSKHCTRRDFAGKVRRLAFTASIYHIWRARNQAVRKEIKYNAVMIVRKIIDEMRLAVDTWKGEKRTQVNLEIALEWGFNCNCFE